MNEHVAANRARQNVMNLVRTLSPNFVGRNRKSSDGSRGDRDEVVFLMAIAVIAREPMLLLGEPGTAKTEMVTRFAEACGAERYFEHTLTMFTEPSEIIGPVDINSLREGEYRRILDGRIAEAQIVFLDEIFKGNSAILNTLLTLMNEHKIYQGSKVVYLGDEVLLGFFAASNEIPDNADIMALKDRFPIKVRLERVPEDQIFDLIQVGVQNDIDRNRGVKPWRNCCSLEDMVSVRRYLLDQFVGNGAGEKSPFRFPEPMERLFRRIVLTLRNELRVTISDRQIVKLYRLVATRAYLDRGAFPRNVEPRDFAMLRYTAERIQEFEAVGRCVDQMIEE